MEPCHSDPAPFWAGDSFDVAILGGAFSGAVLGLLLKRARPHTRVLIIEKSEQFDRKVGESTSEVAGCFLTRVLGLSHYLAGHHYQKHGLRMWFNAPGNQCPGCCTEIGPIAQSRLPTFQIDRSLLDQHLLDLAAEAGCEVLRPATVKALELGGAGHNTVTIKHHGATSRVRAAWVADCSGRAALIARQRGTLRALDAHPVHSMWVRFRNVTDLDSHAARSAVPAFAADMLGARGAATNHLMGRGWWSWIIPLPNGDFSAGVTWDERWFTPPADGSVGERVKRHLVSHPVGRLMFEHAEPVENDARAFKHLPYYSTEVAGDGWVAAGDSAGFMDPLYSQGLDYCSHAVFISHQVLTRALDGHCAATAIHQHNRNFQLSYQRWFNGLYRDKYQYLGDAELMRAAFLLDIATYFLGPVRLVYTDPAREFALMPFHGVPGRAFGWFMALYNRRLSTLATKRLACGSYGRRNTGRRYFIRRPFMPNFGPLRHLAAGLAAWWRLELAHALTRPAATAATAAEIPAQPPRPAA